MRRREAANAAANDDEVVMLTGRIDVGCLEREVAVAQTVRHFEGANVAAAQSVGGGWIISGGVLRLGRLLICGLAILWINVEVLRRNSRNRFARPVGAGRSIHNFVSIHLRHPPVVHIVCVIIGHAAEPKLSH